MRRSIGVAVLTLAALAASAPATAGTAGGTFRINILLSPPGAGGPAVGAAPGVAPGHGICFSDTLSEETGAVVRVVCANGEFVSISPRSGRRFFGTHGGAYGYYFRPTYGVFIAGSGASAGGTGTVTSFRVYSIDEADGPLHMLVSF